MIYVPIYLFLQEFTTKFRKNYTISYSSDGPRLLQFRKIGDLKPANFVFVKGHLKLIDFGIAKSFSNDTTNIYRESQIGTVREENSINEYSCVILDCFNFH